MSNQPIVTKTIRTVKGIECRIIRNDPAHPEYDKPTDIHVCVGHTIYATVYRRHILSEDRWRTFVAIATNAINDYEEFLHCTACLELATELAGEFEPAMLPPAAAHQLDIMPDIPPEIELTDDELPPLDLTPILPPYTTPAPQPAPKLSKAQRAALEILSKVDSAHISNRNKLEKATFGPKKYWGKVSSSAVRALEDKGLARTVGLLNAEITDAGKAALGGNHDLHHE